VTTLAVPRTHRARLPVVWAGLAACAATALVLRDPHVQGSYGVCPVHALTGGYCPGCGSLRACEDLLTGHVGAAFGSNALLPLALAWLGWWWLARVGEATGRRVPHEPSGRVFAWSLLVVVAVFTVLRNLPGSVLAP
jgi:Protein of unknown function (DUF2752)